MKCTLTAFHPQAPTLMPTVALEAWHPFWRRGVGTTTPAWHPSVEGGGGAPIGDVLTIPRELRAAREGWVWLCGGRCKCLGDGLGRVRCLINDSVIARLTSFWNSCAFLYNWFYKCIYTVKEFEELLYLIPHTTLISRYLHRAIYFSNFRPFQDNFLSSCINDALRYVCFSNQFPIELS